MKKIWLLELLMLVGGLALGAAETVLKCDFSPESLKEWKITGDVTSSTKNGKPVLVLNAPTKAGVTVSRKFDISKFAGKYLMFKAKIRTQAVSKPLHSWNGVKFLLKFTDENGQTKYPQAGCPALNFSRRPLEFSVYVPEGATGGSLQLGLEDSSGRMEVSDLEVVALEEKEFFVPPVAIPANFKCEYSDAVKNMPRYRGVMSPNRYTEGDLDELAAWKVNVIRWQISRNFNKVNAELDIDDFNRYIDSKLDELDRVFADCRRLGIKVIVDIHAPVGALLNFNNMRLFFEDKYRDAFIDTWKRIVTRVMPNKDLIYAYGLLNEPYQTNFSKCDYLKTQYMIAEAIRKIDPETPIIISSNGTSSPIAFRYLYPLPLKNIIYEAHMYFPVAYTHQELVKDWPKCGYPGEVKGIYADKEYLREKLQPVREFQEKYGAKIFIGEFSVINGAAGADDYLADVISLFEEYGWDWTYHAFREFPGWSVEHVRNPSGDKPKYIKAPEDTMRKKLLQKYFKLNQSTNK